MFGPQCLKRAGLDQENNIVSGSPIWGLSAPVHHPTPVFGQGLFSASAWMFSMKPCNIQALSRNDDMWPPDCFRLLSPPS